MATILVATASIHTTAAACDHLVGRLRAEDIVIILGVTEPGIDTRDIDDAANVARSRLVEPSVETLSRSGEPADAITAVAEERNADTVVLGATRGDPERPADPPGSTVRALLANAQWPVTVLPTPSP